MKIENWSLKICLAMLLLFFLLPSVTHAANRYWVGAYAGCDATWADTDCWSATSGGAGAAGVPTSADDVFFDGVGDGASSGKFPCSSCYSGTEIYKYILACVETGDRNGNKSLVE